MKRVLLALLLVTAALALAPSAQADGAFQADCTRFFQGSTGGQIIITPSGAILMNCQYPGPAPGGGADTTSYNNCVITPDGNFQCHTARP